MKHAQRVMSLSLVVMMAGCLSGEGEDEPADQPAGDVETVQGAATCGCVEPSALVTEKKRLAAIGGTFSGICGNAAHTYGYHRQPCSLPSSDYSLKGSKNKPLSVNEAAAIDIGMNWTGSRNWLKALIKAKQDGKFAGVAEVIGSYDGTYVMYWSDTDTPGWPTKGVDYYGKMGGTGHQSWSHVAIYRSKTHSDHGILKGWNGSCSSKLCGANNLCCSSSQFCSGDRCCPTNTCVSGCPCAQ